MWMQRNKGYEVIVNYKSEFSDICRKEHYIMASRFKYWKYIALQY